MVRRLERRARGHGYVHPPGRSPGTRRCCRTTGSTRSGWLGRSYEKVIQVPISLYSGILKIAPLSPQDRATAEMLLRDLKNAPAGQ